MTREEAIERIKVWNLSLEHREVLAVIIPELAESENERMLREIKRYLKEQGDKPTGLPNGTVAVSDMIAWLEKQKEQNLIMANSPQLKEQKPAEWSDTDNIGWDEAFACVTQAEKSAKNEEELQNAVTAEKWLKEIKFKYYVHPVKNT